MNEYDGCFDIDNEKIYYRIVDDNSPIRIVKGQEKMRRFIYFYDEKFNFIKSTLLYDYADVLQNITHFNAKIWFEES